MIMQKAVFLASVFILGWTQTSQARGLPDPLYPTQENFDQTRRMKRDVAPTVALAEMELDGSGDDTLMFNGSEVCSLGPEAGACFGLHQRYFYNSSAMSCQMFNYGGCLGNKNNFRSERECLQRCRTEAVCRLPMTAVPCTGEPPNWSFESVVGVCVSYKPGFCQTNGNKFYSKAECEEYCGAKAAIILEED